MSSFQFPVCFCCSTISIPMESIVQWLIDNLIDWFHWLETVFVVQSPGHLHVCYREAFQNYCLFFCLVFRNEQLGFCSIPLFMRLGCFEDLVIVSQIMEWYPLNLRWYFSSRSYFFLFILKLKPSCYWISFLCKNIYLFYDCLYKHVFK